MRKILVPGNHGRTSFVDMRDIAAVAALAITEERGVGRRADGPGSADLR
ncbi:hypothetical protein [Deinococcus hopiensis]|nr:hypothetical protein [Deinococcus hopiensis]